MKIGILGTGVVARTLGAALAGNEHAVTLGTRRPGETLTRTEADHSGPPFGEWKAHHPEIRLGTFPETAEHGEVVINATPGVVSLDALHMAGADPLRGKILIDLANPLDHERGWPPPLAFCNTESLGERIQAAFPDTLVVKTLNTMNCTVMVDPDSVPGPHNLFLSGNDAAAKAGVMGYLVAWFGWSAEQMIDLGDITTARGVEMWMGLWLRLFDAVGHPNINLHIAGRTPAA